MAAELRQIKAYVTVEADLMINTIAEVTERDRSEVIRDVLHEWAVRQLRIAKVAQAKVEAEGLTGSAKVPSSRIANLGRTAPKAGEA